MPESKATHVYIGQRNVDGTIMVTCDGEPLPPRNDLVNHSPDGFNWGYGGSGPAQLALAILANEYGDEKALSAYQAFKWAVIAQLPSAARWTFTSGDVGAVMVQLP